MISHKIAVHQLIDVCTTRVVHVHISCWTTAQQCWATDEPISSEDIS